jgi:hypothetical protein
MDNKCYKNLCKLDLPEIDAFDLNSIVERDYSIKHLNINKNSCFGDKWANFCWVMTPYFIYYTLIRNLMLNDILIYCDADIFFFNSPELLVNDKPVGIHTHRYGGKFTNEHKPGWFNVGVLTFNPTDIAVDVSESWKMWLMNPQNRYAKEFGVCGDQKYLELFPYLWGYDNICVLDEDLNIGHIAPWNFNKGISHHPTKKWHIVYKKKTQPVVFFHFARFWSDGKTYVDCGGGEWSPANDKTILPYYEMYFEYIRKSYKMLGL